MTTGMKLILGMLMQLLLTGYDFSGLKQKICFLFLGRFAVKSDTIVEKKTI